MSHREDCPTRWEAEREGSRDYDRGIGRWNNPYRDEYGSGRRSCEEAERAWEEGYRREERRAEERAEDLRAEQAACRRAEEARRERESDAEWEHQWREPAMPGPSIEELCESGGHEYYGDDNGVPRCYCGRSTQEGPRLEAEP